MAARQTATSDEPPRRAPARSAKARERQLVNLAYDSAEELMREKKASSQIINHFLKMGSTEQELELEKKRKENLLLEAKIEQIKSGQRIEELFTEAMEAFRGYQRTPDEEIPDEILRSQDLY